MGNPSTLPLPIAFVRFVAVLAVLLAAVFALPAAAHADEPAEGDNAVNTQQLPDSSFIYDTSIVDLSGADAYYDNQTVQVTGEVIGDSIRAGVSGRHRWITLSSQGDSATISVYMSNESASKIDTFMSMVLRAPSCKCVARSISGSAPIMKARATFMRKAVTVIAPGERHPDEFDQRVRSGHCRGGRRTGDAGRVLLAEGTAAVGALFVTRRRAFAKEARSSSLIEDIRSCAPTRVVRALRACHRAGERRVRAVIGDFVEVTVPEAMTRASSRVSCRARALRSCAKIPPNARSAGAGCEFRPCVRGATAIRREREAARARAGAGLRDGAAVTVVLTKADLAESDAEVASVRDRVRALAGPDVQTVVVSADDPSSVEAVRALVPPNTTAVLIGKAAWGSRA